MLVSDPALAGEPDARADVQKRDVEPGDGGRVPEEKRVRSCFAWSRGDALDEMSTASSQPPAEGSRARRHIRSSAIYERQSAKTLQSVVDGAFGTMKQADELWCREHTVDLEERAQLVVNLGETSNDRCAVTTRPTVADPIARGPVHTHPPGRRRRRTTATTSLQSGSRRHDRWWP